MTHATTKEYIESYLKVYFDLAKLLLTPEQHDKLKRMIIDFDFVHQTSAGRFERCVFIQDAGTIRFNIDWLSGTNPRTIDIAVGHEVAHAVDYLRHHQIDHGRQWRDIMLDFGLQPNAQIALVHDESEPDHETIRQELAQRVQKRNELLSSPIKRPLLTATGRRRKFSTVFKCVEKSSVDSPDWFDRQSDRAVYVWRIVGSGVNGYARDAKLTDTIAEALEDNGVHVAHTVDAAPWTNCFGSNLKANFLDGGLRATTGNYWVSPRAAWIEGEQAVRWVGDILDLRMPECLVEETEIEVVSKKV